MKKIAVITTTKELKEFQERTDISILDINVKACDQSWATQEYFVAIIEYDDEPKSEYNPDYWTRLEHQAGIAAMQGLILTVSKHMGTDQEVAQWSCEYAHALVEKYKEKEK